MNSSQKGGKSKSSQSSKSSSSKSSQSKSKKGGNFLGSASELFVPTGWESFATAAGLLAIDRADAAFRRSRNSSKKQKGGADLDGHESLEAMDNMLDTIHSEDASSLGSMSGGAKNKSKTAAKKSTKSAKKPAAKKPAAKKAKKAKKSTK